GTGFTITYDAQGDAFEKFDDGTVLETDPSGKPIRQIAADGTTYTDFDGQGRPTRGTTPNGLGFTIAYDPSGGATETFDDGSVMVTDPSGKPIKEVTADGTTFTGFDDKGRPTAGVTKDGHPFTITYDDQGDAFEHNDDGSVVEIGPDGKVIKEVTADGTTFTGFDDKGRPTAGVTKDGHPFTITYDDQGDAFEHNDDGSVVEIGPDGKVIKIWTPDGTEIDFAVEIPALHDAIGKVSAERDSINADFTAMKGKFATIESLWQSPAGASFPPLADTFNTVTQSLLTLLDDAIHRMQTAYENYVNTENTNVQNLN
ncbi:hypothetical protein, partial [Dactylosporangium salmoneum]|uniref:WXG100 family type VII secretion target n=1 Tax=Dactylosporangium salmoneum TaxID=53361 RepID=UPI0031CE3EA1